MDKKPRLGLVGIQIAYTVDLDDERQVTLAKEAAFEDLQSFIKHDALAGTDVINNEPPTLGDIPEFILRETTWLDAAKAELLDLWSDGLDYEDEDGVQETIEAVKANHNLEDDSDLFEYLDKLIAEKESATP